MKSIRQQAEYHDEYLSAQKEYRAALRENVAAIRSKDEARMRETHHACNTAFAKAEKLYRRYLGEREYAFN